MGKTYVLSDVHIGTNGATCWYNKDYHGPYLEAVLQDILDHKAEIDEVILLGDLFDFWTYAPDDNLPSIEDILNANPNIFGPDGKLTKVVAALPGKVKYLRGNHDINITQADLNKIPGESKIELVSDVYVKRDVVYAHGHLYTIFNAPEATVQVQNVTVGRNADGRLEVFYSVMDGKNSIYHTWQTDQHGKWSTPEIFGGLAHNLAIGPNADGHLELVYVGTDGKNSIYHAWQTAPNNGWSGHQPLGGLAQSLAVGQNQDGRLEVFYVGMDGKNSIYHVWQTAPNSGWSGHELFGGQAKSLGVGREANGCLHLFYVNNDNKNSIYHVWQIAPNKGWSKPEPFGGLAQSIAVGQNQDGRLEIFYVGMDGKNSIYHVWQTTLNGSWSKHELFGGQAKSIGMNRDAKDCLHVFYAGNDNQLYHFWQTAPNNGWSEHVPVGEIPVGHFVTRSIMYKIKKERKPAFELPGQGSPSGPEFLINKDLIHATSLTEVMLNGITDWAGMSRDISIKLFNQQQKSITQAKSDYANLRPNWLARYGGGEYAEATVIKSILADAKDYYMGWFAQKLALEQGANLVVMGHTHIPKLGLVEAAANYVNSGFMCPAKPDVEKEKEEDRAKFTFAVIDHPDGNSSQPKLYQVVKQSNKYSLKETSAPSARIIDPPPQLPVPLKDFSCYVWVVNQSGQELYRDQMEAAQGVYVVNPPEKIGVGQTAGFWIQDYAGIHGSEGSVVYTTKAGGRINLFFECPTGTFKNSCSGAKFETKSGNGNWQNQVVEGGHPFFVRFTLNDPTANFQGDCGQGEKGSPKSVASTTGLEPGGAVHINGKTDLSGCIQGNDGARVYGITLTRSSGIYVHQYVFNVDAQGPKGVTSGSMYLAFRDRAGHTYYLSIFDSARKGHTVGYNSNNPAIVKIWWCNYEFKV